MIHGHRYSSSFQFPQSPPLQPPLTSCSCSAPSPAPSHPHPPAAVCRQQSQQAREESERTLGEKDRSLTELQAKIDTMKTEYEQILHVSHPAGRWQ